MPAEDSNMDILDDLFEEKPNNVQKKPPKRSKLVF